MNREEGDQIPIKVRIRDLSDLAKNEDRDLLLPKLSDSDEFRMERLSRGVICASDAGEAEKTSAT